MTMRPSPRKLVLMMSVAGLGLSFGELAHARSEAVPGRLLTNLGAADRQDDREPLPPGTLDDGTLQALDGALDEPDEAVVESSEAYVRNADIAGFIDDSRPATEAVPPAPSRVSQEDRAAMTLAMVLMAEPFSSPSTVRAKGEGVADAAPGDVGNEARPTGAVWSDTADADALAEQWAEALGRDVSPRRPIVADARPVPMPSIEVDIHVGSGADLDVDLDRHAVDLALDFADARFAGLDSTGPVEVDIDAAYPYRARRESDIASVFELDLDLGAAVMAAGVDVDLDVPPATLAQVGPPSALASVAATAPREAARSDIALDLEARVDPLAQASEWGPRIVVATHAERALRSLEALLANADSVSGRLFGAQTEAIFVASEAEKTRLLLSMKKERLFGVSRGALPGLEVAEELGASPSPVASGVIAAAAAVPATISLTPLLDGELAMASAAEPVYVPLDPQRRTVRSALGAEMLAVSEVGLDRVRGGFETSTGLQISFGIDRAVYINGNLVTTTSLNFASGGKGVSGPMPVSTDALGTVSSGTGAGSLTIIQNGAGNVVHSGPVSAANLGTVVQNTLNDQKIQSVTAINATVNSLQIIKAQNLESSLRGALIDSLRR